MIHEEWSTIKYSKIGWKQGEKNNRINNASYWLARNSTVQSVILFVKLCRCCRLDWWGYKRITCLR